MLSQQHLGVLKLLATQEVLYSQITPDAGDILFSYHLRCRWYFILKLLATQEVLYSQITYDAGSILFSIYSRRRRYFILKLLAMQMVFYSQITRNITTTGILHTEYFSMKIMLACFVQNVPITFLFFLHLFYGDDSGYDTFYSSKYV